MTNGLAGTAASRKPECYAVQCHSCDGTVEVPAVEGEQTCPRCGAVLTCEWTGNATKEKPGGEGRAEMEKLDVTTT